MIILLLSGPNWEAESWLITLPPTNIATERGSLQKERCHVGWRKGNMERTRSTLFLESVAFEASLFWVPSNTWSGTRKVPIVSSVLSSASMVDDSMRGPLPVDQLFLGRVPLLNINDRKKLVPLL